MICDKCAGTGQVPDPEDVACEARLKVRHEEIECWAVRAHPGDPHIAMLYEPCPACLGYDEHSGECPRGDETGGVQHWYAWEDGASFPKLVPDQFGEEWGRKWR